MKPPADPDSFHSGDGRVEVVFDPDELTVAEITVATIQLVVSAAVTALDAEHKEGPDRVTVMITDDNRIRELNRRFKGEDEVTDVLSFNEYGEGPSGTALDNENEGASPEFLDFGGPDNIELDRLGDIAISLPQVERQAAENGKPPERELAMLTVHGVLHLLGYDHAEPDDEKIMFGKTDVILQGLFGEQSH